jgi:N4-gp56 family major capsid protein
MATTNFPAGHPLAAKVWARKAHADAVKGTLYGKLLGRGSDAIVQLQDDLKKSKGDSIVFPIRALPTGIGVQDDETLEGTEEGLDYRNFSVSLGEKRKAFKVQLNLSEQRTMLNVRKDQKDTMKEWEEEYIDTTFFEYLSGAGFGTAGASKFHPSGALGGNALLAPSADRIVYGGTGNAAKADIDATDTFKLTDLDKVAERISRASPTMRKGDFDGKRLYVAIISPEQKTALRTNTNTGQWLDIQKAAMMGGQVKDNPIWSSALGVYNDFLLVESTRVPRFTDYGGGSVQAHRALILGAQAAVAAYARDGDEKGRVKVVEKEIDYGKHLGLGATWIWAMQKTRFSGQSDFAVFCLDTAAAPAV